MSDAPRDTALDFPGKLLGLEEVPGARNQDVSSFVHYVQYTECIRF